MTATKAIFRVSFIVQIVEAAWRLSIVTRYNASASMYLADEIFVSKVVTTFCATCKIDHLYILAW